MLPLFVPWVLLNADHKESRSGHPCHRHFKTFLVRCMNPSKECGCPRIKFRFRELSRFFDQDSVSNIEPSLGFRNLGLDYHCELHLEWQLV